MNDRPSLGTQFNAISQRGAVIAECPKCGIRCEDDSISVSNTTVVTVSGKVETTRTFKGTISTKFVVDSFGEFLHRNCLVCGYSWEVATLDSIEVLS